MRKFHAQQIPEIQFGNQSKPPFVAAEQFDDSSSPNWNNAVDPNLTKYWTLHSGIVKFRWDFFSYKIPIASEQLFHQAIVWNLEIHLGIFLTDRFAVEWCQLIDDNMNLISGISLDERIDGIRPRFDRWQCSEELPGILWAEISHWIEYFRWAHISCTFSLPLQWEKWETSLCGGEKYF